MGNVELKESYGSYEIPREIHQLFQLEEEFAEKGLSLSQIGFQPFNQFDPYAITPPDLIAFASTGGDGIHFGFLTDFHSLSDLTEAPIVCVTPTNDPPIRYMARNIREFLDLAFSVPYVEMLETIWSYENEQQAQELAKEFGKDAPRKWKKDRERILTRCREVFGTKKVDVVSYLHEVKKERAESIHMATLDGLGVTDQNSETTSKASFTFSEERKCDEKEMKRMRLFLSQANELEKLAFIRNANYWYIVTSGYDEAVWELIQELLTSMGLHDEAEHVAERC
ncbi:hypothetical protein MHH33_09625 [Paenisporosarcina sp. FSL H8-0542]|uniref:hypothetical protein n=1 Tax=Paenisporosarcina sp. FSL H8-0542 TaxID=2921401 RepID=UPI00315A4AEB